VKEKYRVRQGGLMRCCLLSLDDAMVVAPEPPNPGDRLKCKWCPSHMIFRDGAWQWDQDYASAQGMATTL
jgi:hypothetical protein